MALLITIVVPFPAVASMIQPHPSAGPSRLWWRDRERVPITMTLGSLLRRRLRLAGVTSLLGAGMVLGLTAPAALPSAAQAAPGDSSQPAIFATGGKGRYVDAIQWLQWADYSKFDGVAKPNVPVLDYGETRNFTNTRDLGDAGTLVTTCTLSNLQHLGHPGKMPKEQSTGPLVATIPGAWAGDALDNLYNVGGPGQWTDGSAAWHAGLKYPQDYVNKNQMVIGLANGYAYNGNKTWDGKDWGTPGSDTTPTGFNARVSVDYSCKAELRASDGSVKNVPLQGLVFADAEASSKRFGVKPLRDAPDEWSDEWVQASTSQPVTWRVLDTLKSDNCPTTTNAEISGGGRTLRLMPTGDECVYQNGGRYSRPNGLGGPDAVMLMQGATSATITIQGAGYSAVALGLIVATDFGDAPSSYGNAGALFEPKWTEGEISRTTDVFSVSQASMYMDQSSPVLGTYIDAEGYQEFSDDALGDDENTWWRDDEDAIDTSIWNGGSRGITTGPGKAMQQYVKCGGVGKVAGWIDWNNNGTFEPGEKSDEVACSGGGATLTWTVPVDVTNTVRSVDGETGSRADSYMRIRITNDNNGDNQQPSGITATGEVEDYKVSIRVPTIQLTKKVENPYETDEVPGLTADQWTVSGKGENATVSAEGTTGDHPLAIAAGKVALSESSSSDGAAGYAPGQWTCSETPGTINDAVRGDVKVYSSSVGATDGSGAATLTVNNLDRVSCEITNTAKPGALTWGKRDSATGDALGGSAWTLSGPEVPAGTVVTDCESGTCPAGDYQDQDPAPGRFSLTGLKWGTYSITEQAAPSGYVPSTETFTFPQIKPSALEATLPAGGVVDENGAIGNEPQKGSVAWQKVDADTSEDLAGSEWRLTGPGVPADTVVKDCEQATCVVGAYLDQDPRPGHFKLADLPWNAQAYSLVEAKAPAGYTLSKDSHEFTIAADARDYAFDDPFTNQKSPVPTLPLTGGMGSDVFLMGAAGLFFLTVVAEVVRRRRRRQE